MIKYEKHPTVTTTDVTLPTLEFSEDAQAFASFPEFGFVVHPDYIFNGGVDVLDRSSGEICSSAEGLAIPTTTFPNGSPAFDLQALKALATGNSGQIFSPNEISFSEFSIITVLNSAHGGTTAAAGLGLAGLTPNPRALITVNHFPQMFDNNGAHTQSLDPIPDAIPTLLVFTYADGRGGKILRDGALAASNPADMVRNTESATFPTLFTPQYMNTTTAVQQSGTYVVGIDLSRPEHAGKLSAITNYMMNEYVL